MDQLTQPQNDLDTSVRFDVGQFASVLRTCCIDLCPGWAWSLDDQRIEFTMMREKHMKKLLITTALLFTALPFTFDGVSVVLFRQ
jgi:hypothetical protein